MTNSLPTLEINVYDGRVSAVACLVSIAKGVIEITTDARWCDKAAVFAALEQHVRLAAKGHPAAINKVSGSKTTPQAFAGSILEGQDTGKLTFIRVWSEGYRETVSNLGAPVRNFNDLITDSGSWIP